MGMRHSPEAGYNLKEAHHIGWKPEFTVLVGPYGLWRQEYRNVACRGRIPQFGLRRRKYHNMRDTEVSNEIRYQADIVATKRPYAVTTRESFLLLESHD